MARFALTGPKASQAEIPINAATAALQRTPATQPKWLHRLALWRQPLDQGVLGQ